MTLCQHIAASVFAGLALAISISMVVWEVLS